MRLARKKPKKCLKTKIRKKKNTYKKKKGWFSYGILNTPEIETINHALYINKFQRAECKGSWKVLPKDSVEVYRDRHRRNYNRRRKKHEDDSSDDSIPDKGDDMESSGKHVCKCRVRHKRCDTSCSSYSTGTCDSELSSSVTTSK